MTPIDREISVRQSLAKALRFKSAAMAMSTTPLVDGKVFEEGVAHASYYACFHLSKAAILAMGGEAPRTHKGVQMKAHQLFSQSPEATNDLSESFAQLQEARHLADYIARPTSRTPMELQGIASTSDMTSFFNGLQALVPELQIRDTWAVAQAKADLYLSMKDVVGIRPGPLDGELQYTQAAPPSETMEKGPAVPGYSQGEEKGPAPGVGVQRSRSVQGLGQVGIPRDREETSQRRYAGTGVAGPPETHADRHPSSQRARGGSQRRLRQDALEHGG